MAVMDDVRNSTEPKAPTTLVIDYLRSKGISPSAQSVRNALQENARNGGKLIPGLINEDPGEDPNTKGATGGPGVGRGGGASVASKVEGSRGTNYGANAGDRRVDTGSGGAGGDGGGEKKTSAAPGPVGDTIIPEAALNKAETPRVPADVKNIYQDDAELGPGGALSSSLGGAGGALGVGGAGLAAAILSGQGLPTVPSGPPPIQALPPITPPQPSAVPSGQFGPPVPPDMIAPSAQGPLNPPRPDVPFNSPGPRVAPTAPLMPRSGPPGLNFQPVPGTAPPGAPVESEIVKVLRGLANAGKRFRP